MQKWLPFNFYKFCNTHLKIFFQVWHSSDAWRNTGKNGVQCSAPVPVYPHPHLDRSWTNHLRHLLYHSELCFEVVPWLTVSNDLSRSIKILHAKRVSPCAFCMLSIKVKMIWFVEKSFWNRNCLYQRIYFSTRNSVCWVWISFPKILSVFDKKEMGLYEPRILFVNVYSYDCLQKSRKKSCREQ